MLFAFGLIALLLAMGQAARGERGALYRVFLVALLSAATVLGLEAVLLVAPGVLQGRLANYTFSGYHPERNGIYQRDPHLGHAMKPDFRRRLFWNGHWWSHETNRDGYRGPLLSRADAVFLGDSMVYGHGLEWTEALPAQAAALEGLEVLNLGQPGVSLVQALILFKEKGIGLRPRRVFVCAHPNDAQDSLDVFPAEELEAFLARPDHAPLARPELREAPAASLFDRWADSVALPLLGARLINGLRGKPDWVLQAPAPIRGSRPNDAPYLPGPDAIEAPYPPLNPREPGHLGWLANRKALEELQRISEGIGAELVVFDLGYPRAFSEAAESVAGEIGAAYCPAGRIALGRAQAGEPVYLPHDGHWTARGANLVARELLRCSAARTGPAAVTPSRR